MCKYMCIPARLWCICNIVRALQGVLFYDTAACILQSAFIGLTNYWTRGPETCKTEHPKQQWAQGTNPKRPNKQKHSQDCQWAPKNRHILKAMESRDHAETQTTLESNMYELYEEHTQGDKDCDQKPKTPQEAKRIHEKHKLEDLWKPVRNQDTYTLQTRMRKKHIKTKPGTKRPNNQACYVSFQCCILTLPNIKAPCSLTVEDKHLHLSFSTINMFIYIHRQKNYLKTV